VEHDFTYTFKDKFPSAPKNIVKQKDNHVEARKNKNGEVIRLEKLLQETTRGIEQSVHRILENSTVSADDLRQGFDEQLQEIAMERKSTSELIGYVNKCNEQSFASVAELLRLRLRITIAQREESEEIVGLQNDKASFSEREKTVRESILKESRDAKKRLTLELHQTEKEFKKQLLAIDKKIEKAKERETQVDKRAEDMATNSGYRI
jgi:hypothetical protein